MSPPSELPDPRPRVSQRRYIVRRAGAVAVLIALVAGAVFAARAVLGGEDEPPGAIAGATAPSTTSAATSTVDGTAPATTPETATSTEGETVAVTTPGTATMTMPATTADDPGSGDEVPTVESPARLYIAGDSDAGTFGPFLHELLDDVPEVETQLDYKTSSGLSRPDFFDWPARFAETMAAYDPDIVVVTFGGNDAQGLADATGEFIVGGPVDDTADWKVEYGQRVGNVMDLLSADGRTLIWVGIPNHVKDDVTERMAVQDSVVRAQAGERPDVVFIDTWARFSGRNGGFAQYVIDPRDGEGKSVRAGDGFHLNEIGAEILALDVAEAIYADLRTRGLDI